MAPVKTTGFSGGSDRATRYADSSSVSVPCVTTTPCTSGRARCSAMRMRSAHIRSIVMCGPGNRPHCSTSISATSASPGVAPRCRRR